MSATEGRVEGGAMRVGFIGLGVMGEPMARAKSSAPSDGAPAPGDAP